MAKVDAIIPRVASSQNFFGTSVIRQFEQMGVYCLNASFAVSVSRDKLRSMQILSRHQIGIPHSAFVFDNSDIPSALDRVGGAPVVIKLLRGSQGSGVLLAEKKSVAMSIIEALQLAGHNVLIQHFVAESKGTDIRAFVVGDRVVAAMRRTAQEGEFRSNVHLGGATEAIELAPEYERVALLAAHIMGLRVAGVDLLETSSGPQVLEINSSPGLEGIESATHLDIATCIIEYVEEQMQFPDLDIRERLSLSKGYSIVEIPVGNKSALANKTIEEASILEQEIQVLNIQRKGITIPTPRPIETIYPGDTLLCFGKQLALKTLLPAKRSNRKKPKALDDETIQAAKEAQSESSSPNESIT